MSASPLNVFSHKCVRDQQETIKPRLEAFANYTTIGNGNAEKEKGG